ncbi:MAG: hypothetical protein J0I91_14905 [Candidatus Accumulibacter sp.]|nr:hypothetical protein [Accumulibacter sp.]
MPEEKSLANHRIRRSGEKRRGKTLGSKKGKWKAAFQCIDRSGGENENGAASKDRAARAAASVVQ